MNFYCHWVILELPVQANSMPILEKKNITQLFLIMRIHIYSPTKSCIILSQSFNITIKRSARKNETRSKYLMDRLSPYEKAPLSNDILQQTGPLQRGLGCNLLTLKILDHLKFNKQWAKIFKDMKKTKVKELQISSNDDPLIIKNLTKITFINLRHLDISSNKIVSLQMVSFISFKAINELRLNKNLIRNIKPLRKMVLENDDLSYLDISDNRITSYQDLCHINSFALGKIVINWHNQQVYCPNILGQLLKLPLLGLRALPRQDKRFYKLMYPEPLIMKKYWNPQIGRQNHAIKAKNEKYIRIQSHSQIINVKAQKVISKKLGNEENDPNDPLLIRARRRDESNPVLRIFNPQNKQIIIF